MEGSEKVNISKKIIIVFILIMMYSLYKYSPKVVSLLESLSFNKVHLELIREFLRLFVIVCASVFLIYLTLPAADFVKSLSKSSVEDTKADLIKAKNFSAELIRRLLKSLPFEAILYIIAGADTRHIKNKEDKVRYKTVGIILILVFIYTFVSVNYLMSIGGDSFAKYLIPEKYLKSHVSLNVEEKSNNSDGSASAKVPTVLPHPANPAALNIPGNASKAAKPIVGADVKNGDNTLETHILEIVAAILSQNPILIALIFSLFVISIDRLIISDHSIEYRLFKIRLQQLENESKQINDPSNAINQKRIKFKDQSKSFLGQKIGTIWERVTWFTWGYWTRSRAVSLRAAPANSREWQMDAAALFHPRAFFSILVALVLRGGFAWASSILVSTAILLMIYSGDIDSEVVSLSTSYAAFIGKCSEENKFSIGCVAQESRFKMTELLAEREFFAEVASGETNPPKERYVYCLFERLKKVGNSSDFSYSRPKLVDDKIEPSKLCVTEAAFKLRKHDVSTGKQNFATGVAGAHSSSGGNVHYDEIIQRKKEKEEEIKKLAKQILKTDEDIKELVQKYKNSISARLLALRRLEGKDSISKNASIVVKNAAEKVPVASVGAISNSAESMINSGVNPASKTAAAVVPNAANVSMVSHDNNLKENFNEGLVKSDPESFSKLKLALKIMLIGFELIPVILLKGNVLFGWTPSSYILNAAVERIEEEKALYQKLLNNPWPENGVIPLPKQPEELVEKKLADFDHSELVVGLFMALRLPIFWVGGVAIAAFTLFGKAIETFF